MTPSSKPLWRRPLSSQILVLVGALALAASVMLVLVVMRAAHTSDALDESKQEQLLRHTVEDYRALIVRDQTSVAIWDDAVENVVLSPDPEWVHSNFGKWLFDFFGHEITIILDNRNDPAFVWRNGLLVASSEYDPLKPALVSLVEEIRRRSIEGNAGSVNDTKGEPPANAKIVDLEQRPAMVAVTPIVSDTGKIEQSAGTEYLLVSIQMLDRSFLARVSDRLMLNGARFSRTGELRTGEVRHSLSSDDGKPIGYFVWQPDRPGARILGAIASFTIVPALAFATLIALLVRHLHRASRDIEASEAQAQHLALHDPLTGLPNRALLGQHLDDALERLSHGQSDIALICVDLDRFKGINDQLGHQAGDDLICDVAERLAATIGTGDVVARIGGDEFAIVQSIQNSRDPAALCQRIQQSLREPFDIRGNEAFIGCSMGIAITPADGTDPVELARKADIALYRAKSEGRDRFCFFAEAMDESLRRRRSMETDLRHALDTSEGIVVHYQPLHWAKTGDIRGVEALARWQHPKLGLMPASRFVPIAEECGLIGRLGLLVFRQAVRAALDWPNLTLAVNFSPAQVRRPGAGDLILNTLRDVGFPPHRLEIEITENLLLEGDEVVLETFAGLRAAGVRFALDDFGTGYSSLNYLRRFPVDKIKIDRSFIQALGESSDAVAIVQAIVSLGRALGIEVNAEGVETQAQRDFLIGAGCTELQGYLFSPPIPASAITAMIGGNVRRAEVA